MRFAIISDIHSNLEALGVCLKELENHSVDRILSLGDVVGYNAEPNECVDIVRARDVTSIMGNHDVCACGLREPVDFNPIAKEAIHWTKKVLTSPNNAFLTVLPDNRVIESRPGSHFLVVHGAVTHRDDYIFNEFDARESFDLMREKFKGIRLCFFGHTHRGIVYRYAEGKVSVIEESEIRLDAGAFYLVNPGSVGQPRDGDPRASFLVYDDTSADDGGATIHCFRIEYDVPKSSKKVVAAGLPPQLGQRLLLGI